MRATRSACKATRNANRVWTATMNETATAGMDDSESQGDSEALVEIQDVSKTYDGETLVVEDLNLDIRRGEFLTLLGPSGSGKTTVLLMLAGDRKRTRLNS